MSEDVPLSQSPGNRKFAKSVYRYKNDFQLKPLETFPESFQLSDFNEMQSIITRDFNLAFTLVSLMK